MSLPVTIKEVPFFRFIIPLIAGIAAQYWLAILPYTWWVYLVLILLLGLIFICYFLASHWQFRWCFGTALALFLFFFGAVITTKQPISNKLFDNGTSRMIVYLEDKPQVRANSIRVQAEIKYIQEGNTWHPSNGKSLLYFGLSDSLAFNLQYGSMLIVSVVPQQVAQSGNPYQFDYKRYLSDRGVAFTSYVKAGNWAQLGNEGTYIKKLALQLRDKLVVLFKENSLKDDELAVASALTLGYQDLLDDELRQVYSSSGAMHILSVSGLHVGILYVLLSFVLSFLNKRTLTRALKASILLVFLWFFALLTGLPPCVQRSALMFSFVVVGDFFNRKSNVYNTLAASAFVLLVANPYNLLDIGFQLSYLAVVSIVFFYPYVYRLVFVKNWMLDKVWSLIAVSIAAQFGTFSICLFYFSQFPNYFLLGNLIAIPLSTIALYLSVLLIVVSPFPVIAGFVGKIFSLSVSALNHGLEFVDKLPYSVTEGIHISAMQMFVVVGLIILLSIYLLSKRVGYLFSGLVLIIVFLGLNFASIYENSKANEMVVFNINKKSLVSFRVSNQLMFIDTDTSKVAFSEKYNFFVKGYISAVGANKTYGVLKPSMNDSVAIKNGFLQTANRYGITFISYLNKTIAISFERTLDKMVGDSHVAVDYLVINKYYPRKALDFIDPKFVILDSSASKRTIDEVSLACKLRNIPFHITSSQGAFIIDNWSM